MLELFLPYIIATALGIEPQGAPASMAATTEMAEPVAQITDLASRQPEDQTPTGRFTTAGEVRMILSATKTQWVNVRPYEGQDLLYFTQLMAWRCGLWDVSYGINGAEPEISLPMEPCHEETATPNSISDIPYVTFGLDEVQSVKVRITYDDGTTDEAIYGRAMILIP